MGEILTADLLLRAYAAGIFPMAESRDSPEIFWVEPRMRGIIPLDGFHVSRSLARRIRRGDYRISFDGDFAGVVAGCADRPATWINATIAELYTDLHARDHAHSIEVRDLDGRLVGGVYGVAIGAVFFGESMFSRATDASKLALAYLVDRLKVGSFRLFDTQFLTPHLASLGAIEIPAWDYLACLSDAIAAPARFDAALPVPEPAQMLQRITQTS